MINDRDYEGWAASYGPLVKYQMTEPQERHLMAIKTTLLADIDAKYRKGQKEHGGDLAQKGGMCNMLWEEIIDLPVYFLTLRAQLREIVRVLDDLTPELTARVPEEVWQDYTLVRNRLRAIVEGGGD